MAKDARSCIPKTPKKKMPDEDEDDESPLCPSGYRYNATNQVCDGMYNLKKCSILIQVRE